MSSQISTVKSEIFNIDIRRTSPDCLNRRRLATGGRPGYIDSERLSAGHRLAQYSAAEYVTSTAAGFKAQKFSAIHHSSLSVRQCAKLPISY